MQEHWIILPGGLVLRISNKFSKPSFLIYLPPGTDVKSSVRLIYKW